MFGIGFQEMLLILVVVLLIFGPKRLPDLAKSLGKGLAEFKKASEDVKKSIDEAMKEEEAKEERAGEAPPKERSGDGAGAAAETPPPPETPSQPAESKDSTANNPPISQG